MWRRPGHRCLDRRAIPHRAGPDGSAGNAARATCSRAQAETHSGTGTPVARLRLPRTLVRWRSNGAATGWRGATCAGWPGRTPVCSSRNPTWSAANGPTVLREGHTGPASSLGQEVQRSLAPTQLHMFEPAFEDRRDRAAGCGSFRSAIADECARPCNPLQYVVNDPEPWSKWRSTSCLSRRPSLRAATGRTVLLPREHRPLKAPGRLAGVSAEGRAECAGRAIADPRSHVIQRGAALAKPVTCNGHAPCGPVFHRPCPDHPVEPLAFRRTSTLPSTT